MSESLHGGDRIAEVLVRRGVRALFTLCGGHISPILVAAKARGIRVVDTRHEADAVFAADAFARMTGSVGVAAVTAGPGLTNSITALQNAAMAQSPVVLLGGATATILKGRGSLQDIDQQSIAAPLVKWQGSARTVGELAPGLERALWMAREGVPGPVFLECPVDLLYPEPIAREWYGVVPKPGERPPSLAKRLERLYLGRHLARIFRDRRPGRAPDGAPTPPGPPAGAVSRARRALSRARRPVLVIGSQALALAQPGELIGAIERLGIPVWLSGMARGLLGAEHPLLFRHRRKEALREADLVLLAGVPCDFRLDYGRSIPRRATLVAANRSPADLALNRAPDVGALGDAALFLRALADATDRADRSDWVATLRRREEEREREIERQAETEPAAGVHPLRLLRELDRFLDERAVIVADGGDFVGTAAYIVRPRAPLSWLDPGAFGTLGVGGGFALGAQVARPDAEVWVLWGDGSAAYSVLEMDAFARHGLPVIGLIGNDASWGQIARDQVEILGDEVGTALASSDYQGIAEAFGGVGLTIESSGEVRPTLERARAEAAAGRPVLINARLARSDFRKGSISL